MRTILRKRRTPVGNWRSIAVVAAALNAAYCFSARAVEPGSLPLNQWVRLPARESVRGYEYGRPVFVASRGQLLRWGVIRRIYRVPHAPRNDVRALDLARGQWLSDYPSSEDLKGAPTIHNFGNGVYYMGSAALRDDGKPLPAAVGPAITYDTRRRLVVVALKGLMAAYDPGERKWRDLGARTVIDGKQYPGGPPVYAAGICHDPVSDEILMFPHFSGAGDPKNRDLMDVTGEVSGHLGTLRFSYADKTWRRVGHTFGSDDVRAKRKRVLEELRALSETIDRAHAARREVDPRAIKRLWQLRGELDGPLRVEPPPRCAVPMVYDPYHKVIVLFGGHSGLVRSDIRQQIHLGDQPGALDDTWLYDLKTRQWRELKTNRRPPETRIPNLFWHEPSRSVLLVTFTPGDRREKTGPESALWTLDLSAGRWRWRGRQPFPAKLAYERTYAAKTPVYSVGLDPQQDLLVLAQNVREDKVIRQETLAMRLDLGALPTRPAPTREPDAPVVPQRVPADDPAWLVRLESLPANTWIAAEPRPYEAGRRDWGNVGVDPVRGHVYYFGGGHSTYQVNDVAIYAVGANRWVHAAGDHNDFVPPVGWGGIAMGYRGGRHAHHQRNEYQALDGRMYVDVGGRQRLDGRADDRRLGIAWFYDVDRGGVWRQKRVKLNLGEGVERPFGRPHMPDPSGKLVSLELVPPHRYADGIVEAYFCSYDVYANELTVKKIPPPWPGRVGESRGFCLLPDRQQIFYYEYRRAGGDRPERQRFWMYDVRTNRFTELEPKRRPSMGVCTVVEYLQGHDALLAIVRRGSRDFEQWVYLLEHNTWAELPLRGETPQFAGPYGQMAYVAKYGVLLSVPKTTLILRPDLSGIGELRAAGGPAAQRAFSQPGGLRRNWPRGPLAVGIPVRAARSS